MRVVNKKRFTIFKSIIAVCLVYIVFSAFFGVFSQIGEYKARIAEVNRQIADEQKVSQKLEDDRLNMHSDENYKEIARKTLGLVEPGDKVYINSNDN